MTNEENASDFEIEFANSYMNALQSFLLLHDKTNWTWAERQLLDTAGLTEDDRKIDEDIIDATRIKGIFRRHDAKRTIYLHRLMRAQDGSNDQEKREALLAKFKGIARLNHDQHQHQEDARRMREEAEKQKLLAEQQSSQETNPLREIRVVNPTFQEKDENDGMNDSQRIDLNDGDSATPQSVKSDILISQPEDMQVDIHTNTTPSTNALMSSALPQTLDTIFQNDDLLLEKKQLIGTKRRRSDSSGSDSNASTGKKKSNRKKGKGKSRPRKRSRIDPHPFNRDHSQRPSITRSRSRGGRRA